MISLNKDQAADGWREWLRISNALNLREQPASVYHRAVPTAGGTAEPGTDQRGATRIRSGYRDLILFWIRSGSPRMI